MDNQGYSEQPTSGHMAAPAQPQYGAPPPPPGHNQAYTGQPAPGQMAQPQYGMPPPPGPQPTQSQGPQWMPKPEAITGIPAGLEYLCQIDQLLVQQKVELLEAFTGWETCNKYVINNAVGQQVYFAAEESDACSRQCCGPSRGFVMHITDNNQQEVIRVNRTFKCCAGCQCLAAVDCCAFEVEIEAPVGQVCAYVKQAYSCIAPKYDILDANRQKVLTIEGPLCVCSGPCCTQDQEFKIFTPDMSMEVGKISKQWSGFAKELFTDADNFGVNFPNDLDVRIKAACIGAVFLIDFMFFESSDDGDH